MHRVKREREREKKKGERRTDGEKDREGGKGTPYVNVDSFVNRFIWSGFLRNFWGDAWWRISRRDECWAWTGMLQCVTVCVAVCVVAV